MAADLLRAELTESKKSTAPLNELIVNIQQAAGQIDNLLRFGLDLVCPSVDEYRARKETFDASQYIGQILKFSALQALSGVVVYFWTLPKCRVCLDKDVLTALVRNILGNVFKFTKTNGTVHLHLWTEGSTLNLKFSNSLSEDAVRMPHFESDPFLLVKQTSPCIIKASPHAVSRRLITSTKKGMVIAQNLSRLLSATLVNSTAQGLFTSMLKVPFETAKNLAVTVIMPISVLIADDVAMNLKLLKSQIQRIMPTASIVSSTSVAFALEMVEKQDFKLIVTDLNFNTKLTGYDLAVAAKQKNPKCHCVLVSGDDEVANQEIFNDVLRKPTSEVVLRVMIYSIFDI